MDLPPNGNGAGGADDGRGAGKGSVSQEQYDQLARRLASLEQVLREQGKDLASIELQENGITLLQCHWTIGCSETICMIVCARP